MGIIRQFFGLEEMPSPYVPTTENRAMNIPSRSALAINEQKALQLIPVSRAISVLETAIMQIPVEVYRGIDKVDSPSWLITPDLEGNVSQSEFISSTVVSMAMWGNAFWKVTRGTRGIANVSVIPATNVNIETDAFGSKSYYINGIKVPNGDIVHLKLWQIPGEIYGEGPLQRHKSTLNAAWDLNEYSNNWFKTSAVPTGLLTTTEYLSGDVASANKQAFVESQQTRSVAVLSNGLKYETISLNPEEAQFLENKKSIAREIMTAFGVPSLYLGLSIEGQGMTYVNGNEDRKKLYEDGLQQYIVRIQQALTDLLPRGQEAKFNLTGFLKPNELSRYQAYGLGIDKKFLTADEVREWEGLPPMPEDTTPIVPDPIQQDVPMENTPVDQQVV